MGKTVGITIRAFAFPILHPGQEMALVAPELNHLTPLTSLIERRLTESRLMRELMPRRVNYGITHRPFHIDFLTGARMMGRIPQRDGRGLKGLHPLILEIDEAQDLTNEAWSEVIETFKEGSDGARWLVHGVTRGVRDQFYKITQPESGWKVHGMHSQMRPSWTSEEREAKIEMYGSRNSPDFRRNIYGDHGDAESPLLVAARFLKCVDMEESSDYNENIYQSTSINAEKLEDSGTGIANLIPVPASHRSMWKTFWIGSDVGFTNDPTELLVFAEESDKKQKKPSTLVLVNRVHLERIRHQDQTEAMAHLIMQYNAKVLSMDSTGLGLPLFQDMQDRFPGLAKQVRGYNFSQKLIVGFDSTIEFDEDIDDEVQKTKIEKAVLEASSDIIRDLVDAGRMRVPNDRDVINQFLGETYSSVKSATDIYGRRRFRNAGKSHVLDAARMAVMGWSQAKIEAIVNRDREESVIPMWA